MFRRYRLRDYDFKLILIVLTLSMVGVMTIGSAEPSLQRKQFFGVIVGLIVMIVLSFIDYSFLLKFHWLMYAFNITLLVLVFVAGAKGGAGEGAQRWFEIGGLRFQPSETAKILLILFFAQFIMKHRERINTLKILISCFVLILIPWALVFNQPDLSTSVILLVIFSIALFAGGISYKLVILAIAVVFIAVGTLFSMAHDPDNTILDPYQKKRILSFENPEKYALTEAYQQLNSVTAIASGQLEGKGYKNNEITSVKNGNFISEAQTDFIFAVIGEEYGFRGSVFVIVLLICISLECISIARKSKDLAGMIIAAGMGGLVAFQGFFNIGVATFILPNTGLPMPFVSYGLTSLLSLYIGMGIVMNVRLQARRND